MPAKTYNGSCYCGCVTFAVSIDLAEGTSKCNCKSCWKRRLWIGYVKPEALHVSAGEDNLQFSPEGAPEGRGWFCRNCGVVPYLRLNNADWNGGKTIAVNLATLDDLDPADLLAAAVDYMDGLHDAWWETPAETRHL